MTLEARQKGGPKAPGIPVHERRGRAPGVGLVVAGATGRVGSELLAQLGSVPAVAGLGIHGVLRGALNRTGAVWSRRGVAPAGVREHLASGDAEPASALWRRLLEGPPGRLGPIVFVDCTASPEVGARHQRLLERGIGVVTANKLPLAGPLESFRALREARRRGVPYGTEVTAAAALPVLEILRELESHGDRVRSIEAVLSGSVSAILHRVHGGERFSTAVRCARVEGLTEPHPAEDLGGRDVARKLLILGREGGLGIESEDVAVEPLVPDRLLREEDPERFLLSLESLDGIWRDAVDRARSGGRRLVLVASLRRDDEGAAFRGRVGIEALAEDHSLARPGPGENAVQLETDLHREPPLTLSGAGAGLRVTAAGLLLDVARAVRELVDGHAWTRESPSRPSKIGDQVLKLEESSFGS